MSFVLRPEDFEAFYSAVHERPPFPWQTRLASQVSLGFWPNVLSLPAASGKTSVIDIAVFALACQAARPAPERSTARRIFFVVDRRVVVDEAFDHARRLAAVVLKSRDPVVQEVAERLRALAGRGEWPPLACAQLRGGMYRDHAWICNPLQPVVVTSTVDQVGSRLLYRGYGVTEAMRPVHAGLVGTDSLIILDEAHCSNPFRLTLAAVSRYSRWAERPLATDIRVVTMSATPGPIEQGEQVFELDEQDLGDERLRMRLEIAKPARLVVAVGAKGNRGSEILARRLADEAERLLAAPSRAIGVVVNRVATARLVSERLAGRGHDVVLLTGRMRPIDRDPITRSLRERIGSTAERRPSDRPLFVVATQCIEVGADFDFDAMVTECASLDALRQRFGRLNRIGRLREAPAAIVVREDQTAPASAEDEADPIYGNALAETWRWLCAHADGEVVDMGVRGLARRIEISERDEPGFLADVTVKAADAPVMLPAHLDSWVQTHPVPWPDPDPALFLHGASRSQPDVYVCWRGDLDATESDVDDWLDVLSAAPPTVTECLPVPISEARRWLANQGGAIPGSDLESTATDGTDEREDSRSSVLAMRWRGRCSGAFIDNPLVDLVPGDVIVVPASVGGWERLGHVPAPWNTVARIDRGDEVNLWARARAVLRLHPAMVRSWPDVPARARLLETLGRLPSLGEEDEVEPADDDLWNEVRVLLGDAATEIDGYDEEEQWRWLSAMLAALSRGPRHVKRPIRHPFGGLIFSGRNRIPDLVGRLRSATLDTPDWSDEILDEDDRSAGARAVTLERHCTEVARLARDFAEEAGLGGLAADFELAGLFHDAGKADERFQALLCGGSVLQARATGGLLAKSARLPNTARERRATRRRAGYPDGARHELLSLRMVEGCARGDAAGDRNLVLHLLASHHGWCRPFAPVVFDEPGVEVRAALHGSTLGGRSSTGVERIDSGIAERFWRMVRRYGWWGIAYLEGLFRLADHEASRRAEKDAEQEERAYEVAV